MKYYEHHLGDYMRSCAHLSLLEHGVAFEPRFASRGTHSVESDFMGEKQRKSADREVASVDELVMQFGVRQQVREPSRPRRVLTEARNTFLDVDTFPSQCGQVLTNPESGARHREPASECDDPDHGLTLAHTVIRPV